MKILGISAYYHDSAAAIIENGNILAAAQEERFSRLKHDERFPSQAIQFCLEEAGLNINDLDAIVFYDKPFLKFERILQTFLENAPKGWWQFVSAIPNWLKEKLFIKDQLKSALAEIGEVDWKKTQLLFSKHHLSHAASSFFVSSFQEAAILTIDGVGEWATASIASGKGSKIEILQEMHFPNSLGLLYSAFTYFLGFKVNSGEYKVMGLAPYAEDSEPLVQKYLKDMKESIIQINEDGSFTVNEAYFSYSFSFSMIREKAFSNLFGFKRRAEESKIEKHHYCLAKALQLLTEEIVLAMAIHAQKLTGLSNLCLAGGVALNCVANGKLLESGLFNEIYIQPAAGDAGNAIGAALAAYYMHFSFERKRVNAYDIMKGSRLGPAFSPLAVQRALESFSLDFEALTEDEKIEFAATAIEKGETIAWFQGKMEFGPRALGGRSILGNAMLTETQSKLNLKVKQRESFRPFAPIMLQAEFERLFHQKHSSPYMLFVHKIAPECRFSKSQQSDDLIEIINQKRSVLPAITHVDYSARIQTVSEESDALMYKLLHKVKEKTGFGVLVNTSFNVRGEPIVCAPKDAIATFLSTEIDYLIIENYLVKRENNLALLKNHVSIKLD
jgi:carbamoyltransferase